MGPKNRALCPRCLTTVPPAAIRAQPFLASKPTAHCLHSGPFHLQGQSSQLLASSFSLLLQRGKLRSRMGNFQMGGGAGSSSGPLPQFPLGSPSLLRSIPSSGPPPEYPGSGLGTHPPSRALPGEQGEPSRSGAGSSGPGAPAASQRGLFVWGFVMVSAAPKSVL